MALLSLVKAPDPRLKLISEPVPEVDKALRRFMSDMVETMYAENGVGLAAIQIGVPKRVVVIDLDPGGPASKPVYLVNPRIVEASEELSTYHEGCLSVPEVWDDVKRPARLTVEYRRAQQKADGEGGRVARDLPAARDRSSQRAAVHRSSLQAQALDRLAQIRQAQTQRRLGYLLS